jgi:hypothetical protein
MSPPLMNRKQNTGVLLPDTQQKNEMHEQSSAMGRNSIIALFWYRRRKRRRTGLHCVHPVIKKREEFRCLLHTIW